jgi:hypothetical protein
MQTTQKKLLELLVPVADLPTLALLTWGIDHSYIVEHWHKLPDGYYILVRQEAVSDDIVQGLIKRALIEPHEFALPGPEHKYFAVPTDLGRAVVRNWTKHDGSNSQLAA